MMDFEQIGTMMGARAAIREVSEGANQVIAEKDAELARVRGTLAVEEMHSAGLLAEVRALKAALEKAVPSHPALRDLRVVYDRAFDAEGVRLKIPNPARYRKNIK